MTDTTTMRYLMDHYSGGGDDENNDGDDACGTPTPPPPPISPSSPDMNANDDAKVMTKTKMTRDVDARSSRAGSTGGPSDVLNDSTEGENVDMIILGGGGEGSGGGGDNADETMIVVHSSQQLSPFHHSSCPNLHLLEPSDFDQTTRMGGSTLRKSHTFSSSSTSSWGARIPVAAALTTAAVVGDTRIQTARRKNQTSDLDSLRLVYPDSVTFSGSDDNEPPLRGSVQARLCYHKCASEVGTVSTRLARSKISEHYGSYHRGIGILQSDGIVHDDALLVRLSRQAHAIGSSTRECQYNHVKIHIYDLLTNDSFLEVPYLSCNFPIGKCFNAVNDKCHVLGTGAYHVGVEVRKEILLS
jgi:hypothetical protein